MHAAEFSKLLIQSCSHYGEFLVDSNGTLLYFCDYLLKLTKQQLRHTATLSTAAVLQLTANLKFRLQLRGNQGHHLVHEGTRFKSRGNKLLKLAEEKNSKKIKRNFGLKN